MKYLCGCEAKVIPAEELCELHSSPIDGMPDEPAADIVGSYRGDVSGVKISKDGTECTISVSCDISMVPENTAAWIREIKDNPCFVTVGRFDGSKDIGKGKRGPGRPPKKREEI